MAEIYTDVDGYDFTAVGRRYDHVVRSTLARQKFTRRGETGEKNGTPAVRDPTAATKCWGKNDKTGILHRKNLYFSQLWTVRPTTI